MEAAKNLGKILDMDRYPRRIEGYDISHQSGENTVGSMVVFLNGEPAKKHYRKFKIKTVEGIGFASESDIFLFERSATTDNGSAIDAYYKSTYLDFGAPDAPRRSMRAFLYASPGGSDCEILFETEQKEQVHQLSAPAHPAPQLHDMRIATHRYRFLRFTLSTGATKPTEFYQLDIYTRP